MSDGCLFSFILRGAGCVVLFCFEFLRFEFLPFGFFISYYMSNYYTSTMMIMISYDNENCALRNFNRQHERLECYAEKDTGAN